MSNEIEGKDKPVEGTIKGKPENVTTDDLDAKLVERQAQKKAGETSLKADEAAEKAGKATG